MKQISKEIKREEKKPSYYKSFLYRIEKKLSVEDFREVKDYAKQGIYFYIIHENQDNNRFILISSKHYEEQSEIRPETFSLKKTSDINESFYLKAKYNEFDEKFFKLMKDKSDITINFGTFGSKDFKISKKFKCHTKKIAIDNPNWYKEYMKAKGVKSHKKKLSKLVLAKNKYSDQIYEHFISTLFILPSNEYQKFNDHTIILDEGKTGKSSMVAYNSRKADNLSIAGLYGSSDSLRGKFRGGLVTLTNKTIVIDEVNELVEDKNDKVLSILNTILENGTYDYIKQFSASIKSRNQFIFMGNISDKFNFTLFLEGCMGNTLTIGRRIGIITYDTNLGDFKKGELRPQKIPTYVVAFSEFMTKMIGKILTSKKFISKLNDSKHYQNAEKYYKQEVLKIHKTCEDETTRAFLKSHSEAYDRIFYRALKMFLYNNCDAIINGDENIFDNHLIFKVICESKPIVEKNLLNLRNIITHLENNPLSSNKEKINEYNVNNLPKYYKDLFYVFWKNQDLINVKGIEYNQCKEYGLIKNLIANIKRRGVSKKIKNVLVRYGLRVERKQNSVYFAFSQKNLFLDKVSGIFDEELEDEVEMEDLT